jgi:LysM repeat protein
MNPYKNHPKAVAFLIVSTLLFFTTGCSPLKSSPDDGKHQLELTLQNLQTSLDDVRHDLNCFQTEMQIFDGRIKYFENTLTGLKEHDFERQQTKTGELAQQTILFEHRIAALEQTKASGLQDLQRLASHANETSAAFCQMKSRLDELEQEVFNQNRRFEEVTKLRNHIENMTKASTVEKKSYKVRPGDTLEKIARFHQVSVECIKKTNDLKEDLIIPGQELTIPNGSR